MYASAEDSRTYHLLDDARTKTVCGLHVRQFALPPGSPSALHLSIDKPDDATLCSLCERMTKEDRE